MNEILNMNDEVRCGYKVTAVRKRLWACELRMYIKFNEVCKRYGLNHFLIGGSAIGAIRHQGFIPWDDDIDIGMVRHDFEIFTQIAKKELEVDGKYSVTYGIMDDCVSPLLRIRDNDTTGIIRGEINGLHSKGAFIEIYVFDEVPDDDRMSNEQINKVEHLLYLTNYKLKKPKINSKERLLTNAKILFKTADKLWNDALTECKRYNGKNYRRINTVLLPVYARTGEMLIPVYWSEELETVPFENIYVSVLKNNSEMLTIGYGDYMKLPPVEERGKHHQTTVFYDPDHPYTFYEGKNIPEKFFKGEIGELI